MPFFDVVFLIAFVCGSTVFCVIGFRQAFQDIEAWQRVREPKKANRLAQDDLIHAPMTRSAVLR